MDEQLTAYLEDLYRRGSAHDAEKADRLERLRNVEPDTARLLAVLVRAVSAKRVLELGTSNGYSTLWLADAARSIGGGVLSVDIDPTRTTQARAHLACMHLQDYVELRTEDAALTLSESPTASWEMIFLDAERPAYTSYWPDLIRVLAPSGLLVVDNVLSHSSEVQEFRELVSDHVGVTEAVVPTGAGVLLVVSDSDPGVASARAEGQ